MAGKVKVLRIWRETQVFPAKSEAEAYDVAAAAGRRHSHRPPPMVMVDGGAAQFEIKLWQCHRPPAPTL
jgi:hypothetical protein